MKLYYAPGACSMAPHILLREAGLEFALERVDLRTHTTEGGADYYAINPKGAVPALEIAPGELLTEGPVIGQWVCDQAGRRDLMPEPGSLARYRVMEWQNYISTELHKSFAVLFNSQIPAEVKPIFVRSLRDKFAWVSKQLDGSDHLTGSDFTAADAYLFTVLGWAPLVGVDTSDCTGLNAFAIRVGERASVAAVRQAEGL
ncbi:MAG: glutathione transferase GstA [Pseudomonadota bacterium]|nr:glutathione transferase GstA [Pseudomonadota bacterium]